MADLTTAKLLINSTISTPGAKVLGIDLANFCLNTPMPNPKYMRLRLDINPNKIFTILTLLMDGCTSRFKRGCIVFLKPASLQINYLKSALPPKGTTSANTHLVSSATSGGTSLSA
jgi:hypothetical protein